MENRSGLIVQGDLTQGPLLADCCAIACLAMDGHAERKAALDMIHRHSPGSTRQLTLAADKGYDATGFVSGLSQACVTPHVARKSRYSAIDGGTTRHAEHALSRKHLKNRRAVRLGQNSRGHGSDNVSGRRARPIPLRPDDGRQ
jgi:hypothetical protein